MKELQEKKASGKAGFSIDDDLDENRKGADLELDELWGRIREFMNESSGSGVRGAETSNKMRLVKAFETYDPLSKGVIKK